MSVEGYVALRFMAEYRVVEKNVHIIRRMMNRYMIEEGGCKVINIQQHPSSTNENPITLTVITVANSYKSQNKLVFGTKEGKLQKFCNFDFYLAGLSFVQVNFQFYRDILNVLTYFYAIKSMSLVRLRITQYEMPGEFQLIHFHVSEQLSILRLR